jgi:hypothetical protein
VVDIKAGCEDVGSNHLAQDRDQWQAVVNTVTKPWGAIKRRGIDLFRHCQFPKIG